MNTKSQQAEQTAVEPEVTQRIATRKNTGRAAVAVVTIAIGTALTALLIGVTGNTDAKAPPSPGFTPPYGEELPPKGLDQRLYELAGENRTDEGFAVPPKGVDQRLYELLEEHLERQAARQD